jgi:hypothetical protein
MQSLDVRTSPKRLSPAYGDRPPRVVLSSLALHLLQLRHERVHRVYRSRLRALLRLLLRLRLILLRTLHRGEGVERAQ